MKVYEAKIVTVGFESMGFVRFLAEDWEQANLILKDFLNKKEFYLVTRSRIEDLRELFDLDSIEWKKKVN